MEQELDQYGRPYKCGPNWVPNWLFNETLFQPCCKKHDIAWTEKQGKFKADVVLLQCCWKKALVEPSGVWRARARIQAVIMFFVLTTNPVSYIMYLWSKKQ